MTTFLEINHILRRKLQQKTRTSHFPCALPMSQWFLQFQDPTTLWLCPRIHWPARQLTTRIMNRLPPHDHTKHSDTRLSSPRHESNYHMSQRQFYVFVWLLGKGMMVYFPRQPPSRYSQAMKALTLQYFNSKKIK